MCKHIHAACISHQTQQSTYVSEAITAQTTSNEVKEEINFHTKMLQSSAKQNNNNTLKILSLEISALVAKKLDLPESVVAAVSAHLRAAERMLHMEKPSETVNNLTTSAQLQPANK